MGISQILLVCVLWCFLNQAHSIPSRVNQESSSVGSLVETARHRRAHSDVCGISKKTEADKLSIVHGKDAVLGDWPWMAGLFKGSQKNPQFFCGGSLISNQWVITAAHCCVNGKPDNIKNASTIFVRLGDLDISNSVNDGASPLDILVDKLVTHPQFQIKPYTNDIALIRLKEAVHFTENIHPICLLSGAEYRTNEYYEEKQAVIIGWGALRRGGDSVNRLREASIDIVSYDVCRNYSRITNRYIVDKKALCAGRGDKTDTCQGDSGGPLMLLNEDDERFYLGGITSWGIGCSEGFPGLYSKVASYICWINDVTGIDF